jgi:hypothetical protein
MIQDGESDVALDPTNFDLERMVKMKFVGAPIAVSTNWQDVHHEADKVPLRITTAEPATDVQAAAKVDPLLVTDESGSQLLEMESVRAVPFSNQTVTNSTSRWKRLPSALLSVSTQWHRSQNSGVAIIAVSTLFMMVLVASIAVCWFTHTAQAQHSPKQHSPKKLQNTQDSLGTSSSLPVSQTDSQRQVASKSGPASTQSSLHEKAPSQYSPSLRELPRKAQASSAKAVSLTGAGKLSEVVAKMPCLDVRCKVPPGHICLLSVPSLKGVGFDQMLSITNMNGTTLLWASLAKDGRGSDTVKIYDLDKRSLAYCTVDPSKALDRKASFLILDKQEKPYATITREHSGAQAQAIFRVRPQLAPHSKFDPGWGLALHMNESPGHSYLYLRGQFIAQFVSFQSGGYEGEFASGGDCALLLLCFLLGELIMLRRSAQGFSSTKAV